VNKRKTIDRSESSRAAYPEKVRSAQYEIVTVLARREDYAKLKKKGGPLGSQIAIAMRHYLSRMPGPQGGLQMPSSRQNMALVTTFQCGVPKELCGEMRNLGGRFDFHTIDAIHLFLQGSAS
jgi:hypothetical protein